MRWTPKPRPVDGTDRWVVKFAFLPKQCDDLVGTWIWLERAVCRQRYWSSNLIWKWQRREWFTMEQGLEYLKPEARI